MHALSLRALTLTLLYPTPVQCTVPNTGCATKSPDGCSCKACSSGYMPDGVGGCKQVTLKQGSRHTGWLLVGGSTPQGSVSIWPFHCPPVAVQSHHQLQALLILNNRLLVHPVQCRYVSVTFCTGL